MKYTGAKNNSGILQFFINNIPAHERYFELFAGTAALYYAKKPAKYNVLNDLNPKMVAYHKGRSATNTFVKQADTLLLVDIFDYTREDFIYLDPPYLLADRRSGKALYKYEMMGEDDHVQLLTAALQLDANIMISCRQNELYESILAGWRRKEFKTVDRGGPCVEVIYMNYQEPDILHQYDHCGKNRTDRQRISRKVARFSAKIKALPAYEKHLFIQELIANDPPAVKMFLSALPAL